MKSSVNVRATRLLTWVAICFAAIAMNRAGRARGAVDVPDEYRISGFIAGCQSWTWNRFTVFEAIAKTEEAGGKTIEFYPDQALSPDRRDVKWNHHASDELIEEVKAECRKHHIIPINYGVVSLPNDEKELETVFAFAKKLGVIGITSEPDVAGLDKIEKLVKQYDIRFGIHDHPKRPNDPSYRFWDPNYIAELMKGRDARMGSCADTGHWVRSGIKPIDALKILDGRIMSTHLKDLNAFGPGAHDVPYGEGVSGIREILDELKRQKFEGNISIEYEFHQENPMSYVKKCVEFLQAYGGSK